jgi:hypothetical protein
LFVQPGPHGEVHVIAEYYRTHRTPEEFAYDVLNDGRLGWLVKNARGIFPEPAEPGTTRLLAEKWKLPVLGGTSSEIMPRIRAIDAKLKHRNPHLPWNHEERKPWLLFDRTCSMSRYEMDAYRWPDKRKKAGPNGTEVPEDKDNHVPEALGRFFAGFGLIKENRTRVTSGVTATPPRTRRVPARR